LWANATVQGLAGTACAIPANLAVPEGAACYCAGTQSAPTAQWGYCTDPAVPVAQQINLQFGADGSVLQVAFVSMDHSAPLVGPPQVQICSVGSAPACMNVTGHTTRAPEPQNTSRILSYSFVPLPTLKPETEYTYRCKPGTNPAVWSEWQTMTTRATDGPMRFALFGDQGLYPYSSVGNLLDDRINGKIDFIVHLGDLAYNMAMEAGGRGDGYMFALQPLLSDIPWITVEGNHELEGSPFGVYCPETVYCEGRFLNQTAGYLVAGAASGSGTNEYYSLDVGLVHFVVLNTMPYLGLGRDLRTEQLHWLAADLAKASAPSQRAIVPWIIIATYVQMQLCVFNPYVNCLYPSCWFCRHVPMYCSAIDVDHIRMAHVHMGQQDPLPPYQGCIADGIAVSTAIQNDFEPLMLQYGVDLYAYGHIHSYESTWPVGPNGTVPKQSLDSPLAPVHVLTGAAGPPGTPETFSLPAPFTRKTLSVWSYGRVTVWNASHLTYEHVINTNGSVYDTWTIVQPNHGPFV
jgi:hypothetical protein